MSKGIEYVNVLVPSERGKDWKEFSDKVYGHIEGYTVPQYGDKGSDLITGYTVKDCMTHIEKYAKRYGQQSREGQQELDFLKIAHFAQCAWEKYINADVSGEKEKRIIILDSETDIPNFEYVGNSTSYQGQLLYVYKEK